MKKNAKLKKESREKKNSAHKTWQETCKKICFSLDQKETKPHLCLAPTTTLRRLQKCRHSTDINRVFFFATRTLILFYFCLSLILGSFTFNFSQNAWIDLLSQSRIQCALFFPFLMQIRQNWVQAKGSKYMLNKIIDGGI